MPTDVFAAVTQRSAFRTWAVSGVPVYLTDYRDDGRVDSVFGMPVHYDRLNALDTANTETVAVIGDPEKGIVGTRTDLQYKMLTEATIDVSAAQDGSEMVSLAQQDLVALRVRGRLRVRHREPRHLPEQGRCEPLPVQRPQDPVGQDDGKGGGLRPSTLYREDSYETQPQARRRRRSRQQPDGPRCAGAHDPRHW